MEQKDVVQELCDLKKEGFDFEVGEQSLTNEGIIGMYNYILQRYKKVFKNPQVVNHVAALLKLQINPIPEISNCLGNMITYISYKKEYLMHSSAANPK